MDVRETGLETAQGGELLTDAGGKRRGGGVFDVAEKVLDTDLFGFFGFDGGWGVEEGFARLGAVLGSWSIC